MSTKFGIVLGLGVGYLLGTRAGREKYEAICAKASRLRQSPLVARPMDAAAQKVSEVVRAQGEAVTDKVAEAIKASIFGVATPTQSSSRPAEVIDADIVVEVVDDDYSAR